MKFYIRPNIALTVIALFLSVATLFSQQPAGTHLLSKAINSYVPIGVELTKRVIEEVAVSDQSFDKALRINTFNQQNLSGEVGLLFPLIAPVKKGEVVWISFMARCVKSTRESGEALLEVRLDELIDGKYEWPSFMERGISFGSQWTLTSIPVEIKNLGFHSKNNGNILETKHIRLLFRLDKYPQIMEIGPVTMLNCGNIALKDLPRSLVKFDGDSPDAPWRGEAAERIEKIRKGDLSIIVQDKDGKKIPNANVSVRMTRNAFKWGTCASSSRLLSDNDEWLIYRDTLLKYFNQATFENELKWKHHQKANGYESTFKAIEWLNNKNVSINGSVVVWPSWKHSPQGLDSLKNDTVALRKTVLDWVNLLTSTFKGKIPEWDVINEPTYHHNIVDIIGKEDMVKWYKAAHQNDPTAKLFLNDFTMFHKKENNADGVGCDYEFNTIKYLKDNGAPIHGIAEQAHIGGTPPGIPFVISRLDLFSEFKLPIVISEFDIYSDDDDFKARYMHDFMTAIFSHPSVTGFTQWGFWEGAHWFPIAALWNKDWSIRKHGKVFTDLVSKTWWTNFDGKTNTNGECKVRGFTGDYEIIVDQKGKRTQQKFTLTNSGGVCIVNL